MSVTNLNTMSSNSGLKALVSRHPLLSMYILLFLLAWPGMVLDALSTHGLIGTPPVILGVLTGWAPAIAAAIISGILAGRAGLRSLFGRFLVWRVGGGWYVTGLLLMAVIILGGIGLHILFGGAVPVIPAASVTIWSTAFSFIVMMLVGFVLNTEEVAWRGFALPRLQARYGVLVGCLLLAIPETMIHLPYFWNAGIEFFRTVGLFWYTAFTIAAVFIYTFVFNKTKGSLIIVTVLHESQNAWSNLLSDNTARPFTFTVALMIMIALALILITRGRLGYDQENA